VRLAKDDLTRFAIPHMKRGSSIINSTSIAGYAGNPKAIDYSSTKGGMLQTTSWTLRCD